MSSVDLTTVDLTTVDLTSVDLTSVDSPLQLGEAVQVGGLGSDKCPLTAAAR